ncbi:MAG: hypothetical protein CMP47_11020 [Rickettsiales bacterium]|nr:hypothetical protein [Rickettsiales bacterium]
MVSEAQKSPYDRHNSFSVKEKDTSALRGTDIITRRVDMKVHLSEKTEATSLDVGPDGYREEITASWRG